MTAFKSVKSKYTGAVGVQSQAGTSRRLMVALSLAIIMASGAALWALIQDSAGQTAENSYLPVAMAAPTPTPIVDHCKVLTYEENYLLWRTSAQMVLYGQEVDEPHYQPMWYAVAASISCNVDLTILQPQGFHLGEVTLDLSPPQNYDKFVEWKQSLANHTTTPTYFSDGGK